MEEVWTGLDVSDVKLALLGEWFEFQGCVDDNLELTFVFLGSTFSGSPLRFQICLELLDSVGWDQHLVAEIMITVTSLEFGK